MDEGQRGISIVERQRVGRVLLRGVMACVLVNSQSIQREQRRVPHLQRASGGRKRGMNGEGGVYQRDVNLLIRNIIFSPLAKPLTELGERVKF